MVNPRDIAGNAEEVVGYYHHHNNHDGDVVVVVHLHVFTMCRVSNSGERGGGHANIHDHQLPERGAHAHPRQAQKLLRPPHAGQ